MRINKKTIRPWARLHGYFLYRGFLRRASRWPTDRRRAWIFERLKRTLVLAHEGVPFYRERFQAAGFDPERDFRSVADLERVPLLTKEDVRARHEEMVDSRYELGSVIANTSGTTGQPMTMRLSEAYVALDYACMFRHWARAGYRFRARYAALRSYVPRTAEEPLWKFNWWQNTLYMSAYHLKPGNCEGYIRALLRFRPEYLRGYPSSLNVLAEYAYPYRDQFDFVRGIFTASETLLASERATIERTFGRKLFDWYGMTEPAVVITERDDHEGMEVNWEYGYPEFLPGEVEGEWRLLATSLHNPAMPFIRYDTRDIVTLAAAGAEEEGRLYPRILSVRGRKDECLVTAAGQRLPSLNFYSLLQEKQEILRFQFVQEAFDKVTVKLAVRPGTTDLERLLGGLEVELRRRLGPEFALRLEVTDQFERSADGKTPTFKRLFAIEPPGSRVV